MLLQIKARSRQVTGKKVGRLRREGLIPAVVFGHGLESRGISVPAVDFSRIERRIGPSTLIDLIVDELAPVKALLHKVQIDPRSAKPVHLELVEVGMHDRIKVEVPLHAVGTSPAVSNGGGTLVMGHQSVEVRTSPDHLVPSISVDLSQIQNFTDHITAGDLDLPEGVELLTAPDVILISVTAPRTAEVEEVAGEAGETAAPAGEGESA